jgi:predicted GNAT family acetyltransferase
MICLRLAALTNDLEGRFWATVKQDYCDYYFFIYDWLLQKQRTQVFLALEGDVIVGLMLIYDGNIVQLRGESDAMGFLLENLMLENIEIQAPIDCEEVIIRRFPLFKQKENISLLKLEEGEEHLDVRIKPERLGVEDAGEIALLMNESYPEMWSEVTADFVRQQFMDEGAFWLGIREAGKLVSFGYAVLTPRVTHVTWIATSEHWRNKGYATSILSGLIDECLKNAATSIIYVMENNLVAKNVYLKAGFKPYKSYILLKT